MLYLMLKFASVAVICLITASLGAASNDPDFSGTWTLNSARSQIRSMPLPAAATLRVDQNASGMTAHWSSDSGDKAISSVYPFGSHPQKTNSGGTTTNTVTKWEGDALLVNTLVSGPQNYTVMERWQVSRDGYTLSIRRTIVQTSGETESTLIYEKPGAPTLARRTAPEQHNTAATPPQHPVEPDEDYVVASGTRVLMRLTNAINTKTAAVGDRVYLQTAVPVFVNGELVIPRGSYVTGTITDTKRAGRVKGKSALNVRFDSLTLPNGIARDLTARPSAADAKGNLERKEGKIEGEDNKGGDTRTVATTTAAGAGIGTLAGAAAGHVGMGAGIGAAAGAAAGLGRVLSTRGPDVMLRPGDTMEMIIDHDLHFTPADLRH